MYRAVIQATVLICLGTSVRTDTDSADTRKSYTDKTFWQDEHLSCSTDLDPISYIVQYLRLCVPDCKQHGRFKKEMPLLWSQLFKEALTPCLKYKRNTLHCKGEDDSRCSTLFQPQPYVPPPTSTVSAHVRDQSSSPEVSVALAIGLLLLGLFIGVVMTTFLCLCCPGVHSQLSGCCATNKEKVRKIVNKRKRKTSIVQESTDNPVSFSANISHSTQVTDTDDSAIYNEPSRISSAYHRANSPTAVVDTNAAANQNGRHEQSGIAGVSHPDYNDIYTEFKSTDEHENRYSTLDISERATLPIGATPPTQGETAPHSYFVLEKQEDSHNQPASNTPKYFVLEKQEDTQNQPVPSAPVYFELQP